MASWPWAHRLASAVRCRPGLRAGSTATRRSTRNWPGVTPRALRRYRTPATVPERLPQAADLAFRLAFGFLRTYDRVRGQRGFGGAVAGRGRSPRAGAPAAAGGRARLDGVAGLRPAG